MVLRWYQVNDILTLTHITHSVMQRVSWWWSSSPQPLDAAWTSADGSFTRCACCSISIASCLAQLHTTRHVHHPCHALQAVEAKEGATIRPPNAIRAFITYALFFSYYSKVAGMTVRALYSVACNARLPMCRTGHCHH